MRMSAPTTRKAIATQTREDTRAPNCASTVTSREPSAFMATADHSPSSRGQVIVCVPEPLASTRQKFCSVGGAGCALPSTRR